MGQFDQELDPETGVTLTPDPSLDPLALLALAPPTPPPTASPAMPAPSGPLGPRAAGLSLPIAPSAPPPPGQVQQAIAAALLGLAAGLGPRSSVARGIPSGLLTNEQNTQQLREQAFKNQQLQYHQQQEELLRQAQIAEIARNKAEARSQQFVKNIGLIRTELKTITDKATYDDRITGYANLMQMDPNKLRTLIPPFVAPNAKQRAQAFMNDLFKSPTGQAALKADPMGFLDQKADIDLNGDKTPERRTLREIMAVGEMAMLADDKNNPVGLVPSTDGPIANISLKNKIAEFKVENQRNPTPKELDKLIEEARKAAPDPEIADLNKRLKELQVTGAESSNQLKAIQLGQQPTSEQVAMYGKLLVDHKMSPSQIQILGGGMGQQGRAFLRQVQEAALKQNPDFSFEEAESEYQLTKSPAFQNTVRYMDSTIESMPRVQAAANRLANGRVRAINALLNAGKNQVNNVDLKKFKTDVLFVADEIAKILQGGGTGSGTSDAKLRQASEILSASDSPAAIAGALEEAAAMMGNRRRALTRGTYLERAAPNPRTSAKEELLRRF